MSEYTCERCAGGYGPATHFHECEEVRDNRDDHPLCDICTAYYMGYCEARAGHCGHIRPIDRHNQQSIRWTAGRYLVTVCGIRIGGELVYVDNLPAEERDRLIREFWHMDPADFRWN